MDDILTYVMKTQERMKLASQLAHKNLRTTQQKHRVVRQENQRNGAERRRSNVATPSRQYEHVLSEMERAVQGQKEVGQSQL